MRKAKHCAGAVAIALTVSFGSNCESYNIGSNEREGFIFMSKRPVLEIPKTQLEKSLHIFSFILVGLMLLLSILSWNDLPDKIPIHFNIFGDADRWGGKASILILPIVGFFVFKLTFLLGKAPHMLNYPVKITKENAARVYLEARRMLVLINFEISMMLTFLHVDIVLNVYKKMGFGSWMMPVFFILLFGTIGISIYRIVKLK